MKIKHYMKNNIEKIEVIVERNDQEISTDWRDKLKELGVYTRKMTTKKNMFFCKNEEIIFDAPNVIIRIEELTSQFSLDSLMWLNEVCVNSRVPLYIGENYVVSPDLSQSCKPIFELIDEANTFNQLNKHNIENQNGVVILPRETKTFHYYQLIFHSPKIIIVPVGFRNMETQYMIGQYDYLSFVKSK